MDCIVLNCKGASKFHTVLSDSPYGEPAVTLDRDRTSIESGPDLHMKVSPV